MRNCIRSLGLLLLGLGGALAPVEALACTYTSFYVLQRDTLDGTFMVINGKNVSDTGAIASTRTRAIVCRIGETGCSERVAMLLAASENDRDIALGFPAGYNCAADWGGAPRLIDAARPSSVSLAPSAP
jgi:hypothetical protein